MKQLRKWMNLGLAVVVAVVTLGTDYTMAYATESMMVTEGASTGIEAPATEPSAEPGVSGEGELTEQGAVPATKPGTEPTTEGEPMAPSTQPGATPTTEGEPMASSTQPGATPTTEGEPMTSSTQPGATPATEGEPMPLLTTGSMSVRADVASSGEENAEPDKSEYINDVISNIIVDEENPYRFKYKVGDIEYTADYSDFVENGGEARCKIEIEIGEDAEGDQTIELSEEVLAIVSQLAKERWNMQPGDNLAFDVIVKNANNHIYRYEDTVIDIPNFSVDYEKDDLSRFRDDNGNAIPKMALGSVNYSSEPIKALYDGALVTSDLREMAKLYEKLAEKGYTGEEALSDYLLAYFNEQMGTEYATIEEAYQKDSDRFHRFNNGAQNGFTQKSYTMEELEELAREYPWLGENCKIKKSNSQNGQDTYVIQVTTPEEGYAKSVYNYFYNSCLSIVFGEAGTRLFEDKYQGTGDFDISILDYALNEKGVIDFDHIYEIYGNELAKNQDTYRQEAQDAFAEYARIKKETADNKASQTIDNFVAEYNQKAADAKTRADGIMQQLKKNMTKSIRDSKTNKQYQGTDFLDAEGIFDEEAFLNAYQEDFLAKQFKVSKHTDCNGYRSYSYQDYKEMVADRDAFYNKIYQNYMVKFQATLANNGEKYIANEIKKKENALLQTVLEEEKQNNAQEVMDFVDEMFTSLTESGLTREDALSFAMALSMDGPRTNNFYQNYAFAYYNTLKLHQADGDLNIHKKFVDEDGKEIEGAATDTRAGFSLWRVVLGEDGTEKIQYFVGKTETTEDGIVYYVGSFFSEDEEGYENCLLYTDQNGNILVKYLDEKYSYKVVEKIVEQLAKEDASGTPAWEKSDKYAIDETIYDLVITGGKTTQIEITNELIPEEIEEPTPTPTATPTPTPTGTPTPESTPTPTGSPSVPTPGTNPAPPADGPEVLGARRVPGDQAVLGARRGLDQAVLGKRRRPATGDSNEILGWIALFGFAAAGVYVATGKLKKKAE